ncbi:MAG TPA: pathogenicity locus [Gammaproteobacteria bacterium]|nr:pathogenicity locus [Gammaproteobacteria bacterium]
MESDHKPLLQIPGVGSKFVEKFAQLGIDSIDDLKGRDPLALYQQYCDLCGGKVDRCVLYVFRSAIYYAEHNQHDAEKLKWWNWKD